MPRIPTMAGHSSRRRRTFAKNVAAFILALGAAASSRTPGHAQIPRPEMLVYAIVGDIDSLDPHWMYDGISHEVMWQMYEGLVGYKGGSVTEFEPLLASIVPSKGNGLLSADGLAYTFPIRKGVRFHDGSPLTAEDAKYSLMRLLLMDRAGGGSSLLLEPILGVQTSRDGSGKPIPELFNAADEALRVEGGALVLRLKKPFAPLLSILASYAAIASKPWTVANGGWDGTEKTWTRFNNIPKEGSHLHTHVNGTGPFALDLWNIREKQLVLRRNLNYWRPPPKLTHLIFKTVDEFSTRKLLLQAGDADAAFVERQFLPQLSGLEGVVIDDELPRLGIDGAFIFNFKTQLQGNPYVGSGSLDGDGVPPDFFADVDLRRAFAHAFDYEAFLRDGFRGKGTRARGPIPPAAFGYNYRQAVHSYSPQRAAELFKKAWGGQVWEKGFRLTLTYAQGRADRQLACEILKKGVESVNPKFRVDIRGIQWSTFLSAFIAGKLPLVNARWAMDYPNPHNAVHPFLHSEGFYARAAGYKNPRADLLMEKAVRELDPDKRRALYFDLQQLAYEDLPALFTVDDYFVRARRGWVRDWGYNPILMYGYFYPVYKGEPR
ncbi:MAG: ABC transporter substrate-binding protein [Elusimicrobia bacterium]|nr:ABC transporter substrate-binding protein [Elusimicrobiota bacterium]